MSRPPTPFIPLLEHTGARAGPVGRLEARALLRAGGVLRLEYALSADLASLRIPAAMPDAGRAERLWEHTCFEAFVAQDDSPAYLELNFSPSGQWAVYGFASYRAAMAPAELAEVPRIQVRRGEGRLEVQAALPLSLPAKRLRLALCAVMEDLQGGLSYWALRHPPGRPDFHHRDGFSLTLDGTTESA
ncbi:MAG: DOMON-like domain-containing protein [Steroidobacteraceae bacterium]